MSRGVRSRLSVACILMILCSTVPLLLGMSMFWNITFLISGCSDSRLMNALALRWIRRTLRVIRAWMVLWMPDWDMFRALISLVLAGTGLLGRSLCVRTSLPTVDAARRDCLR